MNRTPNHACHICEKPIYVRPSVIARSKSGYAFCSQDCYGKNCRKPVACIVCGTEILGGRNAKTCSRTCSNKNRAGMKYKGGRPKSNKVNDLRAIRKRLVEDRGSEKCERCGYDEYPAVIQVHHRIERSQGGTDELENLELLCPTCHCVHHHLERQKNMLT